MKSTKLSLAIIVATVFTTSSFAADSLADAFKNGKVSGALQFYYFSKDNGDAGGNNDIFTNGVDLSYKTDSYKGLSLGLTFQSAFSPWADSGGKTAFNGDMYGTGGVLSEGYLAYSNSGVTAKVGRQYIGTKLIAGSGSRVTRESFEAFMVSYNGVKNLTLSGGYITKMQYRTDGTGNIGSFNKTVKGDGFSSVPFDGAYTALATYKTKLFNVNAQYLLIKDAGTALSDIDVEYIDGTFNVPIDNITLALSAQYNTSSGLIGQEGSTVGAKIALKMGALYAHIAYDTNDNTDKTLAGIGNGADWGYAGGVIYGNNYGAGVDTTGVKVGYKIAGVGLAVYYSDYSGSADYNTIGASASYAVPGALKGLGFLVQYDTRNFSANTGTDDTYLRFKANYKF